MSLIPVVFPVRASRAGNVVSRALQSFWSGLLDMAENRPEAKALANLGRMTDADLAAKGLSRTDEIRRILGGRGII